MAGELDGRVALVTGAASGMGRVMARALAAAGAKVAAIDVDTAGLTKLAGENVFGGRLLTLSGDVSKTSACQGVVDTAVQAFGRLDILINCAGVSMAPAAPPGQGRVAFVDANADGFLRILAINMGGA